MSIRPCFNVSHKGDGWEFEITAKAQTATDGEIMIYGNIADRKWYSEDENTFIPKDFDKALKALGSSLKNLFIRVHSYGGSVFAGQAIVTMIDTARKNGVRVTARIDGIGASMGSVIPQAADRLIMAENAMMMIHKPSAMAWGNADSMRNTAEMLDKAESQLVALYMRRFTGTEDELKELIKGKVDGTWLTAEEALAYGLCDEIDEPVEMAACAGGYRVNGMVVSSDALKGAEDKIQIHETNRGEKMIYNEKTDSEIKALLDAGKAVSVKKEGDSYVVAEVPEAELDTTGEFLTAEQVTEATGMESVDGETVVAALAAISKKAEKAGSSFDEVVATLETLEAPNATLTAKAAKYDLLFKNAVQDAIKNGVKANGNDFNSKRWEKILANFTLEEVQAQGEEWLVLAEKTLHAGQGRLSRVPGEKTEANVPDDCFKIR